LCARERLEEVFGDRAGYSTKGSRMTQALLREGTRRELLYSRIGERRLNWERTSGKRVLIDAQNLLDCWSS
jgi:hypothetical protein